VKNKPPLNEDEKIRIEALSANGDSPSRIGKKLERSHHTVQHHLAKPETQARVEDAKKILAQRYAEEARRILDSITPEDITKASLLQKTTSSAICTDKSLALSGQVLSVDVHVLLEAVRVVREMRSNPTSVIVESPSTQEG
jgi:IS30 family transposase